MIVELPADIPFTKPDVMPIVATDKSELSQVPPPIPVNVDVDPAQMVVVPVMADGVGLTVTTVVVAQPVESV